MTFYERCINLRDTYLSIDPNPLKIFILSKLVAYSFYNYKGLDDLPIGETIYINCADIYKNLQEICSNLEKVLLDLGYHHINIKTNYFYQSYSLCFIIKS